MQREISNLFGDDDRKRLWAHLAQLTSLAAGKLGEIKSRPIQQRAPQLIEKWQGVLGALSNVSKTIGNI